MPAAHSSVIGIFQVTVCAIGQPEIRSLPVTVNRTEVSIQLSSWCPGPGLAGDFGLTFAWGAFSIGKDAPAQKMFAFLPRG